jgi:hypothetical protein
MIPQEKIDNFAKNNGYLTAEHIGRWKDYDCYEPKLTDADEIATVGPPILILVDNNGSIRFSTIDEAYQQIDDTTN